MNVPIDTVIELLMANYTFNKGQCDHPYWIRMDCNGWRILEADGLNELRTKVRDYLLTLVPKPVLLSECEEYKNVTTQDETIVYRVGKDVYRSVDNMWVGYADQVQVIQPVEVQ